MVEASQNNDPCVYSKAEELVRLKKAYANQSYYEPIQQPDPVQKARFKNQQTYSTLQELNAHDSGTTVQASFIPPLNNSAPSLPTLGTISGGASLPPLNFT